MTSTRSAAARAKRRKPGVTLTYEAPAPIDRRAFGPDAAAVARVSARAAQRAPLEALQRAVLAEIAASAPEVLRSLARLRADNDATIQRWARRWRLDAPWVHVAAKNTRALWRAWPAARGRRWDANLIDRGHLVTTRGPTPRRPAAIHVRPEHVTWLVRARCLGTPYAALTTPAQTAAQAVARLARRLDLAE